MHRLLAVYRRRCDRAAATLLLLLSRLMSWVVWGLLLAFPLLKLHPLREVGVWLAGKGGIVGMVGSGTKLSFGSIQYEASGGAWHGQATVNGPERWCWWLFNPVGVGLAGKGGMAGSWTKLSFWSIQYKASGGAWRGQRRGNGIRMLDDGLLGVTCYPASFCT
eukprot:scaffold58223_cov34-Attheya_sp.AAC.6